jgi:hypothetical protein
MPWSWPGMSTWSYALTMTSMIIFWTLLIFGAIVLVHYLGGENRSPVGRTLLSSSSPGDPPAATSTGVSASSVLQLRTDHPSSEPLCSPDIHEPRHERRYPSQRSSHREGRLYRFPARQP